MDVDGFIGLLSAWPAQEAVFNPWKQVDEAHDLGPHCPRVRREQLACYLSHRLQTARWMFIGEALGYQGGHFSGLAMTSERLLLGHLKDRGMDPGGILPGREPRRTSRPALKPDGFTEPTATIVWGTLLKNGLAPQSFVLWNAFAWHPFDPQRGLLSNRKPSGAELANGLPALRQFLALFPGLQVVAVGRVAAQWLAKAGVSAQPVRHPAQGGAGRFRRQVRRLLATSP